MRYTPFELKAICQAELITPSTSSEVEQTIITKIEYDSRSKTLQNNALFVALSGVGKDGHAYISDAYNKNCRCFLVNRLPAELNLYPDAFFLKVENTLKALQKLAFHHRNKYNLAVLTIVGSNGKTTLKEWLYDLLSDNYKIVKSPKSYNSQLGVALSLLLIESRHTLGLFELGISKPDEMQSIAQIAQAQVVLFTNIGSPHEANFSSINQKLEEKLIALNNCKTVIYCIDEELIHQKIQEKKTAQTEDYNCFTWGYHANANLKIISEQTDGNELIITLIENEITHTIRLPFANEIWRQNALHLITTCRFYQLAWEEIIAKIQLLKPLPMRMAVKRGKGNSILIDDSYSADIESFEAALKHLNSHAGTLSRMVILGSFDEQNSLSTNHQNRLRKLLDQFQIEEVIGIGNPLNLNPSDNFSYTQFTNTDAFLKNYNLDSLQRKALLIKGARKWQLDKITSFLEEKSHLSKLEINHEAIRNNWAVFKKKLKPKTKIMAMVKAFSYGAGSFEIAGLLQQQGADYLAVAFADEGIHLRQEGINLPIMVMNTEPASFDKLLFYQLEPEVFSISFLKQLIYYLRSLEGKSLKVHLNLDTGMNRLGFNKKEIPELTALLLDNKDVIEVVSVFSHLVGSDDSELNAFSLEQINSFRTMAQTLETELNQTYLKHILNTSGIVNFTADQMDMVRIGLGLYGLESSDKLKDELQNVLRLVTAVSQIRQLKKGETVGYGRKWKALKNSTIAVIPLGYADGFSRALSNGKGRVKIQKTYCPVAGNICMDMTMIDVTDLEVKEGDEVVIFESREELLQMAAALNTIPYEIMAQISARVKREYLDT